jgi:hypothetical protein
LITLSNYQTNPEAGFSWVSNKYSYDLRPLFVRLLFSVAGNKNKNILCIVETKSVAMAVVAERTPKDGMEH